MHKNLFKIKENYQFDTFSFLLFALVSFSFPAVYQLTIPLIILISINQLYRFFKGYVSTNYFFQTYFYLLVYSVIFFRSIHTIILIILLVFITILFFKNSDYKKPKNTTTEILIVVFFALIFINLFIFEPQLKGLDTYLYLLFYPILFLGIKQVSLKVSILKSMKVFISSVLVVTISLLIINLYQLNLTLKTNTFFAESLGLIHVYFGMFLGVANCFLLILYVNSKTYFSKLIDLVIFILFLILLIYIGARIALLALLFVLTIALYRKISLKGYKKSILLTLIIFGFLVLSYNTIPRAKKGIDTIQKVYISLINNDKQDLVDNSWRNMYQRFLVTNYTIKEIKENWFFGIGLQNVKNRISNKILNDGYKYFKPINSHNQYLHTWLGMGLVPFLFFIVMLIYFFRAHAHSYYFLAFFLIILLTESILVRVKGISLFFLFSLLFSLKGKYIYD